MEGEGFFSGESYLPSSSHSLGFLHLWGWRSGRNRQASNNSLTCYINTGYFHHFLWRVGDISLGNHRIRFFGCLLHHSEIAVIKIYVDFREVLHEGDRRSEELSKIKHRWHGTRLSKRHSKCRLRLVASPVRASPSKKLNGNNQFSTSGLAKIHKPGFCRPSSKTSPMYLEDV